MKTGVKITGGSTGAGKVLTSDAFGLATWQTSGIPKGVAVYTTPGSFTFSVPSGVTRLFVEVYGGGGGGAGGVAMGFVNIMEGQRLSGTVGAGGSGGGSNNAGGSGGVIIWW